MIVVPLRALMYVRQIDIEKLEEKYDWEFRTKHQLGVELMTWLVTSLRKLGVEAKLWLVVDGAYAAKPFLKPLMKMGIAVVSRLRKDAVLYGLPSHREPGQQQVRKSGRTSAVGT